MSDRDRACVSPAYEKEISRRLLDAENRAAAAAAGKNCAQAMDEFTLDVREASTLSVAECREEYVAKYRPLVITGLASVTGPSPWSLTRLVAEAGSKRVAVNMVALRWRPHAQ